jgi:hypothetical protein
MQLAWIFLFLWLNSAISSAASPAAHRQQVLEDFGTCKVMADVVGNPVAELHTYETRDCQDQPIRICKLSVTCTGGALLPAEVASTATLNVSCPLTAASHFKCPRDVIDCMAAPFAAAPRYGPEAFDGAPARARKGARE